MSIPSLSGCPHVTNNSDHASQSGFPPPHITKTQSFTHPWRNNSPQTFKNIVQNCDMWPGGKGLFQPMVARNSKVSIVTSVHHSKSRFDRINLCETEANSSSKSGKSTRSTFQGFFLERGPSRRHFQQVCVSREEKCGNRHHFTAVKGFVWTISPRGSPRLPLFPLHGEPQRFLWKFFSLVLVFCAKVSIFRDIHGKFCWLCFFFSLSQKCSGWKASSWISVAIERLAAYVFPVCNSLTWERPSHLFGQAFLNVDPTHRESWRARHCERVMFTS